MSDANDQPDDQVPSSSAGGDDETSSRAEVEPDPTVGERPAPSSGDELEGDERAVGWRPGRRHGRSAETQRGHDDEQ